MTTRSWRYRFLRTLPLGLFACAGSLAAATASFAGSWTLTQVDNSADVGKYASLAVDASNKLHVSYFDSTGKLKYATNKSGSWVVPAPVVSTGVVAAGTAITVDPTGNPQINFYYNASTSSRGMRNAVLSGSTWNIASINGSYLPGTEQSTSIFNRGGYSYIAFVKNAGSLASMVYTKNTTQGNYGAWGGPITLDNTGVAGTYNGIVVDSTGYIHAVGYNSTSTDLFYFTNTSGSMVESTLATSTAIVGKYCSLAIDSKDNLHLAYLETTASPATYRIKYRFKPAGGAWQDAVDVADAGAYGGFSSIAVDSNGVPYISYYYSASSGSGTLRYATNLSGSWAWEDVDSSVANVGQYTAIEVASDQTVSIAYYDVTNSALKVATLTPIPVSFGAVDRGFQSSATTITLVNDQAVAVTMGPLAKTGADPDDFSVESDTCSNALLGPQQSCSAVVRFAPPAGAPRSTARTATLAATRSPYSSFVYALSGSTTANFLVTASTGNGGSISPTKVAVAPGASQSFSVTPDAGFSVGSVVADGSTTLSAPYTLSGVNADHTILATLVSPIRVLESSIFYGSLQSAFSSVNSGWTIQSQSTIPAGDLLVDRDVPVTLSGGYDQNFAAQTGLTNLPGNVIISNGTLTLENVLLQ